MGRVINGIGKGLKSIVDPAHVLFGKAGKAPEYLSSDIAKANEANALAGYNLMGQAQSIQGGEMGNINSQFQNVVDQGAPITQANAEIEARRNALGIAQQNNLRGIQQGVARRGLGGSAAGLFAESQANQANQNQLSNLESSRGALQRQFEQERLQRQGALLGQQNTILSGEAQPAIQTMTQGTPGEKGILGGVAAIAGNYFSGGMSSKLTKNQNQADLYPSDPNGDAMHRAAIAAGGY